MSCSSSSVYAGMRLPPGVRLDPWVSFRMRRRLTGSPSSDPSPPSPRLALGTSSSSSSSSSLSSLSDPAAAPSSGLFAPPIRYATYFAGPLDPASSRVTAVPGRLVPSSFSSAAAKERMKLP